CTPPTWKSRGDSRIRRSKSGSARRWRWRRDSPVKRDIMSELAINGVPVTTASDAELIEELARGRARIAQEIAKRVVGQEAVIEQLLIALFSRGHCLFVGVPGLAKTLLISTLAEALSLSFNRIQFTPDLMPSDITGTDVLEEDHTTGRRAFRVLQDLVLRVPAAEHVIRHAVDLVRRTRPHDTAGKHVKDHVSWGAGPRASQALILAGKARAALQGRPAVDVQDVRALVEPVLRHRVLTNFHAEAEGVDSRRVIAELPREPKA